MSEKEKPKKVKKEKPVKEKPVKVKKEKAPKTKLCPSCKASIPKKAKICPHCAAKQPQKGMAALFGIIAAVLLLLGAAVSIFIFHFPIDPPFEIPKALSETQMGQVMELSTKEEEAVRAVFDECGILAIREVKPLVSNETSATYAVNDAETVNFTDTKDGIVVELDNDTKAVISIDFQKHALYRNNTAIGKASDFYLSSAQRDHYLEMCLTAVKSRLTLPETAVFPAKTAWNYTMDDKKVTVESTVTTKDDSGTSKTQEFTAEFEDGEFVTISFRDIAAPAAPAE